MKVRKLVFEKDFPGASTVREYDFVGECHYGRSLPNCHRPSFYKQLTSTMPCSISLANWSIAACLAER
jgi:hypothetical protein